MLRLALLEGNTVVNLNTIIPYCPISLHNELRDVPSLDPFADAKLLRDIEHNDGVIDRGMYIQSLLTNNLNSRLNDVRWLKALIGDNDCR